MSRVRKIAEIPAGSWTKLGGRRVWVLVLVLAFPLSKKLTGAEKNDANTWLPACAQSTKVVDVQSRFQSPQRLRRVVVCVRPSGLTAADRAKAAADAPGFAGVPAWCPAR
jgi:RND superfamily putative drug exporter